MIALAGIVASMGVTSLDKKADEEKVTILLARQ